MDKVKIKDIALELGLETKDVLGKAKEMGLNVKAANSSVSLEDAEYLAEFIMTGVNNSPYKSTQKMESQTTQTAPKKEESKVQETPKAHAKEQKETPKPKEKVKEPAKEVAAKKTKPKEEPKKEPVIEKKDQTVAPTSLHKRRGLMIVKKKRPKEEPKQTVANDLTMPELASGAKKKKKVKKAPAAPKQTESQKIDIFGGGDINAIDVMDESEMVMLHDLSLNPLDIKEEEKGETKKKFDPTKMRATQQVSFIKQRGISRKSTKRKRKRVEEKTQEVKSVEIPEEVRVYEFAEKIGKTTGDVIKVLFNLGMMVTKNDFLDKDAIEILAEEFEVEVKTINPLEEFDYEREYDDTLSENAVTKPPVITIMGHVDHGKTSLLDKIRSTKVAEREHGGITQHIGAYMIEKDGQKITFIDTPGHEAFTQMRSRGAQSTDIAVIVVAADDGVKPQTKEAIEHAKAADVPFIIAINKIDKPDANPDLAKSGLAELGITPTDWGGEYEFVNVSAHTGEGIDELLELILLQAEILELKADPTKRAKAVVIETSLEKGKGAVATIIMQNGTLKVGDNVVCGATYGRVRALLNEDGKNLKSVSPGEPAVVVGLNKVPNAGDILISVENDKKAREYAQKRAEYIRQKELSKSTKVTLDELSAQIAEGKLKALPIILKADVAGTLEALKASLEKLRNDEVKVNIISAGVGGITDSDLALAETDENIVILGFNVRPTGSLKEKAKKQGITIKTYNVIYDLIDDVKSLLSGLLSPVIREEQIGQAEVKEVFSVPKLGLVAGCLVTDGVINRGAKVRVIRDGVVIYEGEVSSLKRFKDDVREVAKGYECGIGVAGYTDVRPGDYLESFREVEEQATLE